MLKMLLRKMDEFEDSPIAPLVGVMVLFGGLFILLLAPVPDLAVSQ